MRWQLKFTLSPGSRFFLFFFGGFFAGILYGWFFAPGYMEQVGFLSNEFMASYLKKEVDGNNLFGYLFRGRSSSLLLLWIVGGSFLGGILIYLVLVWSGFSIGVYVMAGLLKRGMAGLLFCAGAVFPQCIFYVPAFGFVLLQTLKLPGGRERSRDGLLRYGIVLIISMLLLFLGALMESYVNPLILKKILKIF